MHIRRWIDKRGTRDSHRVTAPPSILRLLYFAGVAWEVAAGADVGTVPSGLKSGTFS